MPVQLYATEQSTPSRAVWMLLEMLELEFEWKETSPFYDTRKPEYLKLNPLHTVPCLVDDGFAISESRAIMLHLVRKYGKENCSLYPKDLELRSKVEQRLFFDLGNVWGLFIKMIVPLIQEKKMYDPALLDSLNESLKIAEDYIKPTGFIAGTPDVTIADISFLAIYTSLVPCGLVKENDYPAIDAWVTRCSKLVKNYKKCNKNGAEKLGEFFKSLVNNVTG